jgi:hypothetical protein
MVALHSRDQGRQRGERSSPSGSRSARCSVSITATTQMDPSEPVQLASEDAPLSAAQRVSPSAATRTPRRPR